MRVMSTKDCLFLSQGNQSECHEYEGMSVLKSGKSKVKVAAVLLLLFFDVYHGGGVRVAQSVR